MWMILLRVKGIIGIIRVATYLENKEIGEKSGKPILNEKIREKSGKFVKKCQSQEKVMENLFCKCLRRCCRGKKITCPGARDKLNFRQDKHIFSPNVLWTSKKFNDSLFFLDKDKLFGNRTSKNFDVLARGTSENL